MQSVREPALESGDDRPVRVYFVARPLGLSGSWHGVWAPSVGARRKEMRRRPLETSRAEEAVQTRDLGPVPALVHFRDVFVRFRVARDVVRLAGLFDVRFGVLRAVPASVGNEREV